MSVLPIVQVVILIIDILFFASLGLSLLFGFIKGWRKSALNLFAFLIPFIIIICLSGVFSDIIMDISIPGFGTIKEFLSENIYISLYPEGTPSPELVELSESVVKAVINLAVYLVGLLVAYLLQFIFRLIFALILRSFIYASSDGEKVSPSLTSRLFGLIPGFLHFVMAMILLFFPLAGVVNVCNMAVEDIGLIETFMIEQDREELSEFDTLFDDINSSLNNSTTGNILNLIKDKETGVSLPGSYLGNLLKIKTKHASVNIIEEYGRLRQILPIYEKIIEETDDGYLIYFDRLTESDLNKMKNIFEKTNLTKLVGPSLRELFIYELSQEITDPEILDIIKQLDILNEINIISDVIVEIINTCYDVKIDLQQPQDILLESSLPTHVDQILEKTMRSTIVRYILLPGIVELIHSSIPEEYTDIKHILTEENIVKCLEQDIASLLTIYQNLAINNNLHNFIFNEEDFDFSTTEALNNIENSVISLFSISLIKGNETELIKTALVAANIEGLTYESLFEDVNPNWSEEVTVLAKTLNAFIQVVNELNLLENSENINLEIFVTKDANGNYVLEKLFNEISNSEVYKNVILNYIESISFEGDIQEIIEIIDLDKVRSLNSDEFKAEFRRLLEIFDILVDMNMFNDEDVKLNKENIKTLVNSVFDSVFIEGRENELIKFALNKANVEGITYENLIGDFNPNWDLEQEVLANVLYDVIGLIEENNVEEFSLQLLVKRDDNNQYIFKNIISDISNSELLKIVIVNYINSIELDSSSKEILDLLNIDIIKNLSAVEFEKEFFGLLDILYYANQMNLFGKGEVYFDKDLITSLINVVFDSTFIKDNEQNIIEYIIRTTELYEALDEHDITLNYEGADWSVEKQNIIDIFAAILDLSDIQDFDLTKILTDRTEDTNNKLINLIDAFGKSHLFGSAIYDIIEKSINGLGYEVTFTDSEKELIVQNTWKKETTNLIELADFCSEKLGDTANYSTISGSEITEIMLKASETVISTKLLGTVLNEMLGTEYLAINPVLEDGSYKYDFTNSITLADTAKDIGALVDLKNHAQNLDMSDITQATESVDSIIESIKILDESGLAKDMIQEVIGEDSGINLDEINLTEEAETIQKVYDVYKEDHENFDINDHPELKEELKESDFAKTILDMLGIVYE